jgi:thioesterase domain-containing protein
MAIRLVNQVKKQFGVELSLATIFQVPTVDQMVMLLPKETKEGIAAAPSASRPRQTSLNNALVPIQTKGTKPPFFCVHGAGGHVLVYSPLADYLGLEQPFYGLQALGVDGKQKPLTSIAAMAERYLQEMRQVRPHGPYYLGGFSMGGEVAFEMAQRLKAEGEEVALLVLFDTFNPARNIRGAGIVPDEAMVLHQPPEIKQVGRVAASRRKVMGHVHRMRQMGLTEQGRYLWNDMKRRFYRLHLEWAFQRAYRTGSPMSYAFLEDYLWETNLKAITNYQPQVYPGRMVLFRSTESLPHNPLHHPLGWGPLARDGVEEYIIDGPHRIMDEPYITDVARILQRCLDEAQARFSEQSAVGSKQ